MGQFAFSRHIGSICGPIFGDTRSLEDRQDMNSAIILCNYVVLGANNIHTILLIVMRCTSGE